MKIKYILLFIISNGLLFFLGLIFGVYTQSIKIENTYPFHLREIFINEQPNCDTYNNFIKRNIVLDSSIVTNERGERFVKVISLKSKEKEINFIVSILNKEQEQFIDEVWLICKWKC